MAHTPHPYIPRARGTTRLKLTITVTPTLLEALHERAAAENRSLSAIAGHVLESVLLAHEDQRPGGAA